MSNLRLLALLLFAVPFFLLSSCNDQTADLTPVSPSVAKGSVVFEFVGPPVRASYNIAQSRMVVVLNGKEHVLENGAELLLPLGEQVLTAFDVYIGQEHRYMMIGDEQRFTVLGDRINKVKVYVIDVQEVDTDGDVDLEITVSPIEAIKSGMERVITRYAGSHVGASVVEELVADGFPTMRFDNGGDRNCYLEVYRRQGNGGSNGNHGEWEEVLYLRVNAQRQAYVNLKQSGTYLVKWNGGEVELSL